MRKDEDRDAAKSAPVFPLLMLLMLFRFLSLSISCFFLSHSPDHDAATLNDQDS